MSHDEGSIGIGLQDAVIFLFQNNVVIPKCNEEEWEFFQSYGKESDDFERFDQIKWEFSPIGRKMYLDKNIPPVPYQH